MIFASASRAEATKEALRTEPENLGSLPNARSGPRDLGRVLPSSKASSGLTSRGYVPRIPELPKRRVKPRGLLGWTFGRRSDRFLNESLRRFYHGRG